MTKYVASINVRNEIIQEEVDVDNLGAANEYFDNFLKYWSKVWFGWKSAFITNVKKAE